MKKSYTIAGMTCGHCVMSVRKELEKLHGVHIIEIGIGSAIVSTEGDSDPTEDVRQAVQRAGYVLRQKE